jgi:hypothetical protein
MDGESLGRRLVAGKVAGVPVVVAAGRVVVVGKLNDG